MKNVLCIVIIKKVISCFNSIILYIIGVEGLAEAKLGEGLW